MFFFFFKQKTAYDMRISDWSSDVCSSDLITIGETYTATDIDKDGDLDGAFAIGSNRVGIATAGAFTGNIVNAGAIAIEGNDSAGIRLGGPLTGKFTNDGTISVLGDRALGVGLQDVTGDIRLAGTISATEPKSTRLNSSP